MLGCGLGISRIALSGALVFVPPVVSAADYVVTNDTEWDAVFANSTATLANKVVEVSGSSFTSRTISNHNFTAAGGALTLRSANASSSIPRLELNTVDGLNCTGLNLQMTGWPKTYPALVRWDGGRIDNVKFNGGTTFRHGYGVSLTDFDTTAALPEYNRVDNVQTATTTTATYALSWQDSAATDNWIEFFNRGTEDVYVAFGGSGITATTGDTLVPADSKTRFTGLDATTDTHFAILAAANTSEVNARTEIGLSYYLADGFEFSGAVDLGDIEVNGCTFTDLANAEKGIFRAEVLTIRNNLFDRIYMDIMAGGLGDDGTAYLINNRLCLPFARSGIAENLNGDARDPHGDQSQMFGAGTASLGPIYSAGNLTIPTPRRTGCSGQGNFWSDNNFSPSYDMVYSICDAYLGGAQNAMNVGEMPLYPAGNTYVYGFTGFAIDEPLTDGVSAIETHTDGNYTNYIGYSIAQAYNFEGVDVPLDNSINLTAAAVPANVFPSLASFTGTLTRAQIISALTPAAEGLGLGLATIGDVLDVTASDPADVIQWANLPSGASWASQVDLATSTVVELGAKRILNRQPSQAVSVGAGTEWQKLDTDGTTVLTAWGTASGTIEPDQYIEIRATTSASDLTTVTASATINGFTHSVDLTTAVGTPTQYLTTAGGYFVDPSNVPSSTTRITFRVKIRLPAAFGSFKLFTQESTGCDLEILSSGTPRLRVEDGAGAVALNNSSFGSSTFVAETWHDVVLDVDQAAGTATLTLDGVDDVQSWTPGANAFFQTSREISMLGTTTGGNLISNGAFIADLEVDFNGSLHKAISNVPATANADPWKTGVDFT